MNLSAETTFKILAIIVVFSQSEASVANLLADRALVKLSEWIKTDGSTWLTLPGHFQQGRIHNVDNQFTLAFAGPKLTSIGDITRSGDAILDDAEPDPLYKSTQKLRFKATLTNVTVTYKNVAYTEDDFGSYNFTPIASTDSTTVEMVIDMKGDLGTCVGFPNTINVNANGVTSVTVGDKRTDESVPAVLAAVSTHFKSNMIANLQTLLESGTFSSLENYDICNDTYNPLLPANMLAQQILGNVVEGLNSNVSNWAWLPGFWKQFHAPNGTVTNFLRVDVGNFSSAGNVQRVGDASYASEDSQLSITMNFETDSLTAFYRSIYFTDHTTKYNLSGTIKTQKLSFSLTVQFYKSPYSRIPSCNDDSLQVDVTYSGGQLLTDLEPRLSKDLSEMVNSTLVDGFLRSLNEAATDLFRTAAIRAVSAACPKSTSDLVSGTDVLPPANEIADKILAAMAELLEKHASDWTHLPGTWQQYFAENGTLINYVAAGFGNFTSAGSMQKIDAAYSDNSDLNIIFEADSMSAIYGNVTYTSNWFQYKMVETIKTKKIKSSVSVSFSPQEGSGVMTCYGGSVAAGVRFEESDLDITNLTPGVPDDVQSLVKSQLGGAFLHDAIGALEELYNTVAMNVLAEVCAH